MKAFYIVHPTLWTKMTCWWFSTFMAPVSDSQEQGAFGRLINNELLCFQAIKNKIHNLRALDDLSVVVDQKSLDLPMFITEQDMIFNGLRYYQP